MLVKVHNAEQTIELGQKLASLLQAGDVILLEGDLGAGKTTFTQGIGNGLGIDRPIKSPTFTIIREYQQGRLPLYHMDIYRLENGGSEELGLDEYFDGDGVSIVEWAHFVSADLPNHYLLVKLERGGDADTRTLTMTPSGERYQKILDQMENQNE